MFDDFSIAKLDRGFYISTLSSPLMSGSNYAAVGKRSPFSGVELDLADSFRYRFQRWNLAKPNHALDQIVSIWCPANIDRMLPSRLESFLDTRGSEENPKHLVVDVPTRRMANMATMQLEMAIKLRHRYGDRFRIAVAVRPYQIESTRAHLANISNLRMQVSEWDIDLALDLSRELDWLWESEAAVYRMIQSLALVRLTYPTASFDGRFRASLTHRTIATCSELQYPGHFSLVAPLPWWHWRNANALEAACREAANGVQRRFAHREGLSDLPIQFEAPSENR